MGETSRNARLFIKFLLLLVMLNFKLTLVKPRASDFFLL